MPNLRVSLPQQRNTTVSLETYPYFIRIILAATTNPCCITSLLTSQRFTDEGLAHETSLSFGITTQRPICSINSVDV